MIHSGYSQPIPWRTPGVCGRQVISRQPDVDARHRQGAMSKETLQAENVQPVPQAFGGEEAPQHVRGDVDASSARQSAQDFADTGRGKTEYGIVVT